MRVEFKDLKYRKLSGAEGQKALRRATGSKPKKQASKPSPRPKLESLVRSATSPARIRIAEGFEIDLLYSVPMEKQGSWVAMCMDDKNRLIVSDQYGGIYRFPVPPAGERVDPASIEQITYATEKPGMGTPTEAQAKLPLIGHAQGLCYAFDSLYAWSIRGPVRRERESSDCLTPTRTTSSTRSSPSGNSPQPEESTVLTRSCLLRMASTSTW